MIFKKIKKKRVFLSKFWTLKLLKFGEVVSYIIFHSFPLKWDIVPCVDIDDGISDKDGDNCIDYVGNADWCGHWDTENFKSKELCCECGGGMKGGKFMLR